jgi:uncharacterized sodium:solute symporter family permease YidK
MLAALLGMIVSTLAAMFNAASTIFTMDIYKEYLHRGASEKTLVSVGRISVVVVMIASCTLAPALADPKFGGVFKFIQEFQGFISSGVLAAFLFGFLVRKAPRMCGVTALLLNPIIYGLLMNFASHLSFLDRMSITFVSIVAVMTLMTLLKPLKEPFKLQAATDIDLRQSKKAMLLGAVVIMLAGCTLAPALADPKFGGVFKFIQEFQGFISPGVLAAFLFGFLVRRAPRMCGVTALLLNPIIYGLLMNFASHLSFLDRMSITFVTIVAVMTLMTLLKPLKEPFQLQKATDIDLRWSKSAMLLGAIVVVLTIALYAYFWDYETSMFAGMFGK